MKSFVDSVAQWSRFQRNRNIVIQAVFLFFVTLLGVYFFVRASGLELSLSHFSSRAGFGLSHTFLVDYTSNDSRWVAYFTGVVNTIRVCLVAIFLTTLLGTVMGVARLSKNFLTSKIAWTYVEVLRNTPLLIQIIFWQIVFLQLPQISEAITFGDTTAISNRGILLPWISDNGNAQVWFIFLGIVAAGSLYLSYFLNKREDVSGKSFSIFGNRLNGNLAGISLFVIVTIVTYFAFGRPVSMDIPEITQNNKGTWMQSGGFDLSPEFAAILFALVIYTGTFITEIVRGSIQSLSKGQTEAAQAIGLSKYQAMTLVILPQALRSIIPPLTNQFLNLTKNSSLAVVIAYPDLFMVSRTIMNNSGHALPVFFLILLTYLFLSLCISLVMNLINRRVTRIGA
ncbi:MAG: ABC transporter permease subunit [SAR202 cluster bacterium]|nr:ABC transporter permease subunit [SAR202 cluster bacterium]